MTRLAASMYFIYSRVWNLNSKYRSKHGLYSPILTFPTCWVIKLSSPYYEKQFESIHFSLCNSLNYETFKNWLNQFFWKFWPSANIFLNFSMHFFPIFLISRANFNTLSFVRQGLNLHDQLIKLPLPSPSSLVSTNIWERLSWALVLTTGWRRKSGEQTQH